MTSLSIKTSLHQLINSIDDEAQLSKAYQVISENPFHFPIFNYKRKMRRCVLSQQTTLYYLVKGTHIVLISFRSNLKNPLNVGI